MKTSGLLLLGSFLSTHELVSSLASNHHYVMELFMKSHRQTSYTLPLEDRPQSYRGGRINCEDGLVTVPDNGEVYECNGVDLFSFISSEELLIPGSQTPDMHSSDIWGWTSPSGTELTLLTLDTGLVIIDSTNPENPCIVAKSHSARAPAPWGDVKVVNGVAYTIKDRSPFFGETSPTVGMEIYDLAQYAEMDCSVPDYEIPQVRPDYTTDYHGFCHNVISNTETGRIYAVGCATCDGGLVILDVAADPIQPPMIGCVDQDGYTHDAQCVLYNGPDSRYYGREICFAFNEDTLTIWDVTFASQPKLLSRVFYDNQAYSHQGWLTKDMSKILLDDELDEVCNLGKVEEEALCNALVQGTLSGKTVTTTNVFDVSNLEEPVMEFVFDFTDTSIDHNLYEWGTIHQRGWSGSGTKPMIPSQDYAYMHNYMAGLRVVDIASNNPADWSEVKFFDITNETEIEFFGVWSGYMFPSGHYALSSIEKGVFFVDTNAEFVVAPPLPTFPVIQPPDTTNDDNDGTDGTTETTEDDDTSAPLLLYFFLFVAIAATVWFGVLLHRNKERADLKDEEESLKVGSL